ncbi:uncharacterized protein [Coffea arabica]|uniref:Uncharacterized protein isoform X1 n=1 Tax=Coffea arabica TaxID=13443 RepID=A0A6P6TZA7_COFAR|nr:uncharacterized protein LOC113704959 isoform X1 [Coffea arabica]
MSVNLQSAVASSRCHPSPLLLPSIDIFLCFAFVQWLYRFSAFLCICTTAIEFLRFSPPDFLLLNIMTSAILNLPFPDLLPWLRFALVLLTLLPASAVIRFCGVGPLCTNSFCCYSVLRSLTSSYKQYPILFPQGECGWHHGVKKLHKRKRNADSCETDFNVDPSSVDDPSHLLDLERRAVDHGKNEEDTVSAREYYCYRFQIREDDESMLLHCLRLLQQFSVDSYLIRFAFIKCLTLQLQTI